MRATLFLRVRTDERNFWNAGLGLYFCRLVAEAHGGSIAIEDAPGWNVSFVLKLPLAGALATPVTVQRAAR